MRSMPIDAALLFVSSLLLQEAPVPQASAPHLEFEDPAGAIVEVSVEGLELADPRTRGGWLVRPVGFEADVGPAPEAELALVSLAGGEELRGRVLGGAEETLRLELIGAVELPLAIERIRSISFPARLPETQLTPISPADEGDRLYRRTGGALDPIDGTVEQFTAEGVRFDSVLGSRTFPWSEVAALFIEVLDSSPRPPDDEHPEVVVDLVDGSRVRARLVGLFADSVRLALEGVADFRLAFAVVAEIQVEDGRLTFLSELEPTGEVGKGAPFGDELGMVWPHRMDRSALGMPLKAGKRIHRRGIGMHAPSRLTFELAAKDGFRALRGAVAIDDSSLVNADGARGTVIFRVIADGKTAWESGLVRGGDEPLDFPPIALEGVRELALEVDPAGDFAGDRADWLRVLLVR